MLLTTQLEVIMSLGWGILGTGAIAERAIGPALSRAANTKLVAVCDCDMERAKSFAAKYRVERYYDSLEKMLGDPELNVLFIATPNSQHAQQTIQAAEAGKHVLCEKPMALTVPDCELMIQACNKNKVKLGIDFQVRYHPAHIEARRYIQSGMVGEINVAKAQMCSGHDRGHWKGRGWQGWRNDPSIGGAGALVGMGVHAIDLLRFLLDSEVEEVRALTDEEPPRYPVDDMDYVIIKFESGVHGVVISGVLAPRSDNDLVLYGSKAKITGKGTVESSLLGELLVEGDSFNMRMTFPCDDPIPALYTRLLEAFNRCIEEDTKPEVSGHDGLEMVRVVNAILESSRQGKAIKITR